MEHRVGACVTGTVTPTFLVLERPMAMACLRDVIRFALRFRCSNFSCTNVPAWVLGDFPARAAWRVRVIVCFFGTVSFSVAAPSASIHPVFPGP